MSTEVDVRLYDLYLHKSDGNANDANEYQHKNDGIIRRKMDIYVDRDRQVVISSIVNKFLICLIPPNAIERGTRSVDFS
jgi:hypothetical protein